MASNSKEYNRQYYKEHLAKDLGYIKKSRERINKWRRDYIKTHPEYERKRKCKQRYGVTFDEVKQLLESQDNKCAICEKYIPGLGLNGYIDHDHSTGKIRGILCPSCNTILGLSHDNINLLLKAIKYLKEKYELAQNLST